MTGLEMVQLHDKFKNMAFPMTVKIDGKTGYITGLSKAEYFAGQFLAGLLATGKFSELLENGNIVGHDVAVELAATFGESLAKRMSEGKWAHQQKDQTQSE